MSPRLTSGLGAFVDVAPRRRHRWRWPLPPLPRAAVFRRRVRRAHPGDQRLLRDPGRELEHARGLHRPVLARPARLRRRRRLRLGPPRLSPAHAALGQHPRGRRHGGRRRACCSACSCCSMRAIYLSIATWAFAETLRIFLGAAYEFTRGDLGLSVPSLYGHVRPDDLLLHLPGRRRALPPPDPRPAEVADRLFHARRAGRSRCARSRSPSTPRA